MIKQRIAVVHYMNQFFGQVGGEEAAGCSPMVEPGTIGPGKILQSLLGDEAKIVATVVCGDNYFTENTEQALQEIMRLISGYVPRIVIAGPAFGSGRYSLACGEVCKTCQEMLNCVVLTAMSPEAPGAEIYRRHFYIVKTENTAREMKAALSALARLALKLANNEKIGPANEEGYLPRAFRTNRIHDKLAAERAVDMVLAKVNGQPFCTELALSRLPGVKPASAITDLSSSTLALITTGGLVPKGNPDRLESVWATKYCKYDIGCLDDLVSGQFEARHGGYSPVLVEEDPDRMLPVDVIRELEKEGRIKKLHPYFYSTAGIGMALHTAARMGREIAGELSQANVGGVILTATSATCTRCGAAIVKEIERQGIPAVLVTAVVRVALHTGANRILVGYAITHPAGCPSSDYMEERKSRRSLIEKALALLKTEVTGPTVFSSS